MSQQPLAILTTRRVLARIEKKMSEPVVNALACRASELCTAAGPVMHSDVCEIGSELRFKERTRVLPAID